MSKITKKVKASQEPIEAGNGTISRLLGSFLGGLLDKMFNGSGKDKPKIEEESYDKKTGVTVMDITIGEGEDERHIKMQATPIDFKENYKPNDEFKELTEEWKKKPKFMVIMKANDDDGKPVQKKWDILEGDKWDEAIQQFARECNFPIDAISDKKEVASSIRATFQKVKCSDGVEVHLTSITASCAPSTAMRAIQSVMASDEFVDELSEEPTSYSITDVGEDMYDVEPCGATDIPSGDVYQEAFDAILTESIKLMSIAQTIAWNCGPCTDVSNVCRLASSMSWRIRDMIDRVAALRLEKCGSVPAFHTYLQCDDCMSTDEASMTTQVQNVIDALELYYCNMEHDIQHVIDGWIREWKENQFSYCLKECDPAAACDPDMGCDPTV